MSIAIELKRRIKGDVYDDEEILGAFSTDASLFEVRPTLVVSPRDVSDVKELVRFATERGISLTARSGGTGMDGGALSEEIVVDFKKYFTQLGDITPTHATTEPGVFYRDFEKATLLQGGIMPSFPASREICTVGGMVANNAGGERTLLYGKTEEYVKELKVVFSDGNEYVVRPLTKDELEEKIVQNDFEGRVYRDVYALVREYKELLKKAKPDVHKNSAGYFLWNVWDEESQIFDLTKLIVGSQGTLCLVTEITFRLVRPEDFSQMVVFFLDDLTRLGALVKRVLSHEPTTFESYDDKTMRLAFRFAPSLVRRLGFSKIFKLVYHMFPEALSIFKGGFPKLVLQVTFRGNDREILKDKAGKLVENVKEFEPRYTEVIKTDTEAEEYWLIRRESFNLLRHKVEGMKTAPFIDDISVRPDVLPQFLPDLEDILAPYQEYMMYNIAGHIGDGNFHIIPLMKLGDPVVRSIIPELAQKVYNLVFEYGGSTTGEHNDGIIRTPFLRGQYGDDVVRLFEKTKQIFDPQNIFNPGKKVPSTLSGYGGGTLDYMTRHIKRHN